MATILIVFSTTDGHTLKICRCLQHMIEKKDHTVTLVSIDDGLQMNLQPFDKIVIGASIRYGKHNPNVYKLIKQNQKILESKPSAFFSVNVVARKPEKNQPDTNPYIKSFLQQAAWRPTELAVFAGKLDYPSYRFWDKLIIRVIMWLTNGPTDPQTVVEFTDWKQVESFGCLVSNI